MKEALKLALDVLEYWDVHGKLHQPTEEAITAIKAALAQPAQEPTGMLHIDRLDKWLDASLKERKAQRTWVSLTFAEICECENDYLHLFARAVEAKLKDKNGFPQEDKNT